MNASYLQWMNYSIDIAMYTPGSGLRVGAVLVSSHNELICSAYAGEKGNNSWCSVLLDKVRKLKIFNAQSIYITINTLSEDLRFDLNDFLKEVCVKDIYLGLPDPVLSFYLDDDPLISFNCVYRYPVELQRKILEQNSYSFAKSKQSIKYNLFYFENRISNSIMKKLKERGFFVSREEINANKSRFLLTNVICTKYKLEYEKANSIVYDVISEAFNDKYATYNYLADTRSLDSAWKDHFLSIYKQVDNNNLSMKHILNIGVGSGYEAVALFSKCPYITFVDIAQDGLEKLKEELPQSKIIMSSADDLSTIPDSSYNLYVSLRTYNSSFFDIKKALAEANRVLESNASIIISVANGFLNSKEHRIIPGLIIPGTDFVDIYRGMDTVEMIQTGLFQLGFKNIKIYPTNTEIYLSAISTKRSVE